MNDYLVMLLAAAGGVMLGTIFFGGLWWTVQKGITSEFAAVWFIGSRVLRTALVLIGFYLISKGSPLNLIACLLGFIAARIGVIFSLHKKGNPCA